MSLLARSTTRSSTSGSVATNFARPETYRKSRVTMMLFDEPRPMELNAESGAT